MSTNPNPPLIAPTDKEQAAILELLKAAGESESPIERIVAATAVKHGLKYTFSVLVAADILKAAVAAGVIPRAEGGNKDLLVETFSHLVEDLHKRLPPT